ncbi:MAG: dihydroneopterin aldolase [Negativicutes bacterium]|nr:dihydroneopterin aldolase [Negativicutes bacterium]
MKDKVRLQNMTFYGYHGVYEHEKQHGQRFCLDVELAADFATPAESDNLTDAIDYTQVYAQIKDIVENKRFNLLEALAGHIAETLLSAHPIMAVTVRVRKPGSPLPGALDYVEIELTREAQP